MVSLSEFIAVVEVPSLRGERAAHELATAYQASARGAILLLLDDASPEACDQLLDRIVPACTGRVRGVRYAIRVGAASTDSTDAAPDESESGTPLPVDEALLDRLRDAGIPWLRLQDVAEAFQIAR